MNIPKKHHYIPAFYLQRWRAASCKLIEHSRPVPGTVKTKEVSEEATGFHKFLYSIPGVDDANAQMLEQRFFKPLDEAASKVLDKFYLERDAQLTDQEKIAWARFILSLSVRSPEGIAESKEFVAKDWRSALEFDNELTRNFTDDPKKVADWLDNSSDHEKERVALQCSLDFINGNVGTITSMNWGLRRLDSSFFELLTSDRPLIITNGIGYSHSYIALPIGPDRYFYAYRSPDTLEEHLSRRNIDRDMNYIVVARAAKFVWSKNYSQGVFINKHLATVPSPSLFSMMRGRLEGTRRPAGSSAARDEG